MNRCPIFKKNTDLGPFGNWNKTEHIYTVEYKQIIYDKFKVQILLNKKTAFNW